MSVKSLKLIIVLLALALLAACFKIYSLNQTQNPQSPVSAPNASSHVQANRDTAGTNASRDTWGSASIAIGRLPPEAQQVLRKIQNRETFPYRQDGQVFGNRERLLPNQPRGYYKEYTVPTPGADNRGARRIVAGQGKVGDVASSGEYYYTADHYRSFSRIRME